MKWQLHSNSGVQVFQFACKKLGKMNFNLTMPNKFLHLGFGENSTRGNGSEMTFCDSDLIEWSHTHELFTCIGIALVAFSCVGNSVAIIFIARNSSLHTPTYTGIACLALCDLIAAIFRFLKFRSHAIYIIINGCVNKGQFIMDDTLSILSFFTLNSSWSWCPWFGTSWFLVLLRHMWV